MLTISGCRYWYYGFETRRMPGFFSSLSTYHVCVLYQVPLGSRSLLKIEALLNSSGQNRIVSSINLYRQKPKSCSIVEVALVRKLLDDVLDGVEQVAGDLVGVVVEQLGPLHRGALHQVVGVDWMTDVTQRVLT